MVEYYKNLRDEIDTYERKLLEVKCILERAEKACNHSWTQPESDPIRIKGYTIPEFGRGTSDYTPSMDVPAQITPRWKRECKICGKVEFTTNVTKITTNFPRF